MMPKEKWKRQNRDDGAITPAHAPTPLVVRSYNRNTPIKANRISSNRVVPTEGRITLSDAKIMKSQFLDEQPDLADYSIWIMGQPFIRNLKNVSWMSMADQHATCICL